MLIQRLGVHGTNCYLIEGQDGTLVVDPGPPTGVATVIRQTQAAGITPEQIRLILITHGHLDHYGAARELQAWCQAPIAAHSLAPAFSQERRSAIPPGQTLRASLIRGLYLLFVPLLRLEPLQADLYLEEGDNLSAHGLDARMLLVPGHAPGSLAILTSEGDIFVGDLFVNYTLPSQPLYLSDRAAWQRSRDRVQAIGPRQVYVGHGEPFAGTSLDHLYPARYQLRWWVR
jgi:hydroxyacylglutathione hydrolase